MNPADLNGLQDAVARNAPAVLSLPSAGMLRHTRTRFLAAEDAGLWVESPPGHEPLLRQLIADRGLVGMSLRHGTAKHIFTTTVRQLHPAFQVNLEMAVDALLVDWPADVKTVQRRSDYRALTSAESGLGVHAWRVPNHHHLPDKPPASAEIHVVLRDLSVGGMGLLWQPAAGQQRIAVEQRLRIVLTHAGGGLLLDGRVRHVRDLPGGNVRVGVQFRRMAETVEGRRAEALLCRIVGALQREEARRYRWYAAGA